MSLTKKEAIAKQSELSISAVDMVNVWKRFPGVLANKAIDLQLRGGEIHALLGENGAGKTTLMKILSGYYRPDSGTILINDQPANISSPADAMQAGIGLVHQHFRLLETMTVAENIHLGWHETPRVVSERSLAEKTEAICAQYSMRINPNAKIWQLSVGEQQRVEILRVLARGADVLILDEPTAVLTPQEADELFEVIRELAANGRSIVFISHKLDEVLAVSDRVTILRKGAVVETRKTSDCTAQSLAQLMIGYNLVSHLKRSPIQVNNPVLEIQDVHADGDRGLQALHGLNLQLRSGEIVGIAGVAGNGQRELAEVITGLRAVTGGHILVKGDDRTGCSPAELALEGIGHVPEDRCNEGLVLDLSISDNAIMRNYKFKPFSNQGILNTTEIVKFTQKLVTESDVRTPGINVPVRTLSGGNQQKLLVGREMDTATSVLVAVHPTRGLDVAATENVRQFLMKYRNESGSVLLISEDLDEILLMSDRILVIYEGRIKGEFEASQADIEEIGLLMGGKAEGQKIAYE